MIVFTNMGASDDRLHASVCMARERPELIRMVMIVLNSSSIYKTLFFGEILQTSIGQGCNSTLVRKSIRERPNTGSPFADCSKRPSSAPASGDVSG